MTKLKHIREQPLLSPPGRAEWWVPTEADVGLLEAGLAKARKEGTPWNVARMLEHMNRIGIAGKPTDGEVKWMLNDFAEKGGGTNYLTLKKLGARVELPQEEIERLRGLLAKMRKEGIYFLFSQSLRELKEIGIVADAEEGDFRIMRDDLDMTRRMIERGGSTASDNKVVYLAQSLANAKHFGLDETTPQDMESFRLELNAFRRNRGQTMREALNHAGLLHALMELNPETQQTQHPMPPIKRFGK